MEARKTFSETSVPRGLVVLAAVGVTIGLAVTGALATRNLGASDTSVKSTVQAPASLPLRQDNDYPVIAGHAGTNRGAATHKGRMGGPIDSSNDFTTYTPGWDARSVREGHGP